MITPDIPEDLPLTDDDLADAAETMATEGRRLLRYAEQARLELLGRMVERGATQLDTERWAGSLKPGPIIHEVDAAEMLALAALIPPSKWEQVYVQKPAPPPAWDHRELNELVKLGGNIAKVIALARTSRRGEPTLVLKKKEEIA